MQHSPIEQSVEYEHENAVATHAEINRKANKDLMMTVEAKPEETVKNLTRISE